MKKPIEIKPSTNPRVPAAPLYYHAVPLQIRFNDIDMLGHLNNGVYLNFMDLGKASYFSAVMDGNIEWDKIGVVVVNINVNFFSPTYIDSKISVFTAVTAISQHSLTMDQRIVDIVTGDVKCQATTIMAGFDMNNACSAPIAPEWREALERWEQRPLSVDR